MDRLIYTAMNGAKEVMLRQASNNHNLANLNTTGFRADLDTFRSLPMYGPGHPTRAYIQDERAGIDTSQGQVITTGNPLDITINGEGFIAVQAPDGSEAYTRAGDLRISSAGLLENGAGHLVLGNGGPIAVPPFNKLEIGKDGTITVQPLGQGVTTLAVVDRIKLVNPASGDVEKGKDGLLRTRDGTPAEPDASVSVVNGAVEGSNVNSIEALVNMIELAREFEMHIRMQKTAEEADSATASIVRLA